MLYVIYLSHFSLGSKSALNIEQLTTMKNPSVRKCIFLIHRTYNILQYIKGPTILKYKKKYFFCQIFLAGSSVFFFFLLKPTAVIFIRSNSEWWQIKQGALGWTEVCHQSFGGGEVKNMKYLLNNVCEEKCFSKIFYLQMD